LAFPQSSGSGLNLITAKTSLIWGSIHAQAALSNYIARFDDYNEQMQQRQ
jgi:hypothetical protein